MTKSTITRERLEKIISWRETYGAGSNVMLPAEEAEALALIALAAMGSEPMAEVLSNRPGNDTSTIDRALPVGTKLYRHAQPAVDSEFIPKNLDKALGVLGMAIPESREEFNFQTERWIQRLIDRVIRYADEFQEQPASVVQCPYPCGWDNLNKLAIQDAALVARGLVEGEPITDAQRQAAISNNDRLLKVISACRAAMLSGGKP